jgi:hypothetical protein
MLYITFLVDNLIIYIKVCITGDFTQGFTHAGQVLSGLSHASSSFVLYFVFEIDLPNFPGLTSNS